MVSKNIVDLYSIWGALHRSQLFCIFITLHPDPANNKTTCVSFVRVNIVCVCVCSRRNKIFQHKDLPEAGKGRCYE